MTYLPDDLLLIIFTYLAASTDRKQDPEWYSRPALRPLAVSYLVACERVRRQWKHLIRSSRMDDAWLSMQCRDFASAGIWSCLPLLCRSRYITLFLHSHHSRAARATISGIAVYPDAVFATSAYDPSWTYNLLFQAHQRGTNQSWPLVDLGVLGGWSANDFAIVVFRNSMRHLYDYPSPDSQDVLLDHESAMYTDDYVPTPGLEGVIFIGRSDGARALLGRFDSTLIGKGGIEDDGWTGECSDEPHLYCTPVFVQSLVRDIFFGQAEYTLTLRVQVEYERRHPENGGWISDIELELIPKMYPHPDSPIDRQMATSPDARNAFMRTLVDRLQWWHAAMEQ